MMQETGAWSDAEQSELRTIYFAGARETVEDLQETLLRLETSAANEDLQALKRYVHTLKGDSHSVGLTAIGSLCHRMEDIVPALSDRAETGGAIALLFACVDELRSLLEAAESGTETRDAAAMERRIDRFLEKTGAPASRPAEHSMTEYQMLQVETTRGAGMQVYRWEGSFHEECAERGVAARMVMQRMNGIGQVITVFPDPETEEIESADQFTVLVASDLNRDEVLRAASITGIIRGLQITVYDGKETGPGGPETGVRAGEAAPPPPSDSFLRVDASRVDRLMNLVGELIIGRSMVSQAAAEAREMSPSESAERLRAISAYLERTVKDLQKSVMRMRMVPVNHTLRKVPRMVRDLSLAKGKQVRVEIQGREIELDKRIVDGLGEPLAHIVRNMIDHGIEDPSDRRAAGKSEEGLISLRAYHEGASVVLEVSDDGRGIDTVKLRKKAVERGILSPDEAAKLREPDIINLIFRSGLSTADRVTDTSGRGVGMDAVKTAVEGMRGAIEIVSTPGKGTTMLLRMPLTLAAIKALLFQAGDRLFALPLSSVVEIARIESGDVTTVDGMETLLLRGRTVSLVRLTKLFSLPSLDPAKRYALVLKQGNHRTGLLVDRVAGQQDLVIKPVESIVSCSDAVAGASILGDGKVVLILEAAALVRQAVEKAKKEKTAA